MHIKHENVDSKFILLLLFYILLKFQMQAISNIFRYIFGML